MPSIKDPVVVVQPGPGRLPDGTVSATALTFTLGAGSNASLQAHINNAVNAHPSSAIDTPGFGGSGPRTTPAGSVASSLIDVYSALNTQAALVIDAAGTTANSDFFGAGALISAMATTTKKLFFIRPGVYNWNDSSIIDGKIIIGDGSGTVEIRNLAGNLRVGSNCLFRNLYLNVSGSIQVPGTAGLGGNTFENVLLTAVGFWNVDSTFNRFMQCRRGSATPVRLVIGASGGHNLFSQLNINQISDANLIGSNSYHACVVDGTPDDPSVNIVRLTGDHTSIAGMTVAPTGALTADVFSVLGDYNSLKNIEIGPISSTTGRVFSLSGDDNKINGVDIHSVTTSLGSVLVSGDRNEVLSISTISSVSTDSAVTISGTLNRLGVYLSSPGSANAHLNVTGNANTVGGFTINPAGAPGTTTVITAPGSDNRIDDVSLTGVTAGVFVLSAGVRNIFNRLKMESCTATLGSFVEAAGNHNSFNDVSLITCSGGGGLTCYGILCSGEQVTVNHANFVSVSVTDSASSLIRLQGANSVARDILGSSVTWGSASPALNIGGSNCHLTGVRLTAFTQPSTSASGVSVNGSRCSAKNIHFDTSTGVVIPLLVTSGAGNLIEDVRVTGVASLAGVGAQILAMSGDSCTVRGVSVIACPTFGTTRTLFRVSTARECEISDVKLDTIGATINLNAPVFDCAPASTSTNVILRRWDLSNIVRTNNTHVFNIDSTMFNGLRMENVSVAGTVTSAGTQGRQLHLTPFSVTSATLLDHLILLQACDFISTVSTDHCAFIAAVNKKLEVEGCYFSTSTTTTGNEAVRCNGNVLATFRNCTFEGITAAGSATSANVFERCTFRGISSGTNNQLFYGAGSVTAAGTSNIGGPLVIRNCQMLVGPSNIQATGTSRRPMVFLGGSDVTSSVHGAVIVDGLEIKRNPSLAVPSFWHKAPTLCIDTVNQVSGGVFGTSSPSSFSNITIDLEGAPFTGDALNTSVFDTNGTFGCVLEVRGPFIGSQGSCKTVLKNISLLRLPRNGGGGNRSALKARGVAIENLVVDAAAGSPTNWVGPAVALSSATLENGDFWPTTSLPLGTSGGAASLYADGDSKCNHVVMRNFAVGSAEQTNCVILDGASMSNSFIHMQVGSNLPLGSPMVLLNNVTDDCVFFSNKITYFHNASSSADVRVVLQVLSDNAKVTNNFFQNLAVANTGTYSSFAPNSNGGGCQVRISGERVQFEGNWIEYQWENDTDNVASITSSGNKVNIIGNFTKNTATNAHGTFGGTQIVEVTGGLYTNVSNNTIEGSNTTAFNVRLDTSGGTSGIVIGNRIDNAGGSGTGHISTSSTDKPEPNLNTNTPVDTTFNQLV